MAERNPPPPRRGSIRKSEDDFLGRRSPEGPLTAPRQISPNLNSDDHSWASRRPHDPIQLLKSQNGPKKCAPAFDAALLYSLHSDCTPVAWGLTELGMAPIRRADSERQT